MSLKDNLDEFLAEEGWYEVEGAEGAHGPRILSAAASSCSHKVRDLLAVCRGNGCGDALVIEEDWRA